MAVTGRDRLVYVRALEAIRPPGVALDSAVIEYSEAKAVLDGHSLSDAARFYMRHHGHGIHHKPVAEAVSEMIAAKREAGLSAAYLADLRYRLGLLAGAFACNVNDIGADDLREFFQSLALKPRGFNNTVATVSTFFAFCGDRRWLAKGAGAELLAGVHKRKEKSVPVEIYHAATQAPNAPSPQTAPTPPPPARTSRCNSPPRLRSARAASRCGRRAGARPSRNELQLGGFLNHGFHG
jgi:hypothetical protein